MANLTRRGALGVLACAAASLALPTTLLTGCSAAHERSVVIYSCGEGEANEVLLQAMHADLPDYDIRLHYVSTGTCAAKIRVEGAQSEADIVLMLEGGYLRQIQPSLAPLDDFGYDFSVFEDDLLDGTRTYLPWRRESSCIALAAEELAARGIPEPQSYDDLLDPAFKGLICMPNPKSSGTGFNFLRNLINTRGEDEAFAYFDALAENVYQFPSSGSGPVNALVQGEALVGLGLTYQAVSEINQGVPLKVTFFEEGAPWTMNGVSVIAGKQDKPGVRAVMDWLYERGILLDKERFVPDRVFRDQHTEIENYPTDIHYADMEGIFDIDEKQRLLKKWKY